MAEHMCSNIPNLMWEAQLTVLKGKNDENGDSSCEMHVTLQTVNHVWYTSDLSIT